MDTARDSKTSFIRLTEKALPEKDLDKLIECLLEREPYCMELINRKISLDESEVEDLLVKETKIIERLEKERINLLKDMDNLSKNRAAIRTYIPKYPFPPMPVFFEKKG
jgi:hypothetical protein